LENLEAKRQVEIIRDRAETLVTPEDLYEKIKNSLETKRPLKVKLGVDPSAPDLHLGHVVVMKKLREFQELGHEIYFVIGDFTGMIGDPSGRSTTRRQLSAEEVRVNAETYREQATLILDPEKTHTVFNSTWLSPLSFAQIIQLGSKFTVARMLERDDFRKRYEGGLPIGVHEFLYPFAQAYDSVAIGADVELGGTDQTFNLLVGRAIQPEYGQKPQVCLTLPILVGLDGVQKMSKSLGNYIGINEDPNDMYGKTMSIPDELICRYFTLVTRVPLAEIEEMDKSMREGSLNPRDAKMKLAREIIGMYHGEEAANAAEERFRTIFQKNDLPEDVPEYRTDLSADLWLPKLLAEAGLVSSTSEGKRQIKAGAVKVNGQKVGEENIRLKSGDVVQVGKRKFVRLQ